MKQNNMNACQVSCEMKIDFAPSMPIRLVRALVMATPGAFIWLAAAKASWDREETLEEAAESQATKFDTTLYHKIKEDVYKMYDNIVFDCEQKNNYTIE